MGFLDDLKKQAGSLQAQQGDGQRLAERSLQLVEAAAQPLRQYLMELAAHLDVIRPTTQRRYTLDKRVVVEGQPLTDFRFDARRKIVNDREVLDHVFIAGSMKTGRAVTLSKDFVNEMESLERRLAQANTPFEREAVRNPDNGKLIEVRYAFTADVQVSTLVTCHHDRGALHFTLRNLDGLESVDCEFAAHEVTQARLDELARWWVGEPNRFLDGASGLRRVEAR